MHDQIIKGESNIFARCQLTQVWEQGLVKYPDREKGRDGANLQ